MAEADNSSPIFATHVIIGTIRYSSTFPTLPPPNLIPLIFMAARIEFLSSRMVGKRRNMTHIGIVIASGICSFSIAALNSLTVVVLITYRPII